MTVLRLLAARLDLAGIPDVDDMAEVEVDTGEASLLEISIRVDANSLEHPTYYPLARIMTPAGIYAIPLEPTLQLENARDSADALRALLSPRQ